MSASPSSTDSKKHFPCDTCHSKRVKCVIDDEITETGPCNYCIARQIKCTFDRPRKPKGPAPGTKYNKSEIVKPRRNAPMSSHTSPTVSPTSSIIASILLEPKSFPDYPIPDDVTCNHLINIYFKYISPMCPILSKDSLTTIRLKDPMLLNALMCLSTKFSSFPTQQNSLGIYLLPTVSKQFFARAKTLMLPSLANPSLETIQGLILILYSIVAFAGASSGWTWTGATATSLAQLLGLPSSTNQEELSTWKTLQELDVISSTIFVTKPLLEPCTIDFTDVRSALFSLFSQIMHNRANPKPATTLQLINTLSYLESTLDTLILNTENLNIILLHAIITTYIEGPMVRPGQAPTSKDPDFIFGSWALLPSFPLMYRSATRASKSLALDTNNKALALHGSDPGIGIFRLCQVILAHSRFFPLDAGLDALLISTLSSTLQQHGQVWSVSTQLNLVLKSLVILSKLPSVGNQVEVEVKVPGGSSTKFLVPEESRQHLESSNQLLQTMNDNSIEFFQGTLS